MFEFVLGAIIAAIPAGTVLLYGALGEIVAEKSGVINLGVEGMLLMGAVTGFAVTYTTGSLWLGVLAAVVAGGSLALVHAFATVTLRINQIVSGLALTMLGIGLSGLLGREYVGKALPVRLQPLFGDVAFSFDPLTYGAALLAVLVWFVLRATSWGLRLRSVGENPAVAASAGINVLRVRYGAVVFGGLMAGLGGAYLSLVYTPAWNERMTSGAGWIVIALTISSLWEPARALWGAYLFGGVRILQFRLQPLGISPNLLNMLPYLVTIAVLIGGTARRRFFAPAALGAPYFKEGEQ